jgi:DNA-binding transcriptional LysR family regulator
MLELVRLRALAAVAEHGSVTAAARELHYAQPSISHHLARLEADVGVPLTQRVGRGIRLTPAGELLARRAVEILGRVRSAEDELAAIAELRMGTVRVAGFQTALGTFVTRAAVAMKASAPGIELNLTEMHPDVALGQLREGTVDVAVVFRYDEAVPDDMQFQHLFDDPMYLISRDAGQTLVANRDSDWIAGCERCRNELVDTCEAEGFTPRIMYTSDDPIIKQSLVAAGLGVTTMPGLALATYRVDGVVASELSNFRRRVYVATYGEPPRPFATESFIGAVTRAAADLDLRSA